VALKRVASRTKTRGSKGYVAISADLERDIHAWIQYSGLLRKISSYPLRPARHSKFATIRAVF
jgi:hypothetical protein